MVMPQQNVQSLVRLMGVLLLLISVSGGTASAQDQLSAQNIIRVVIRIEDRHTWQELAQYWITEEQPTLTAFLEDEQNKSNGVGYFNIQSAKLVELKELPLESAKPFVDVDKYIELYGGAKVFYVGIDYTVKQESKYYYNGVNYRLVTLIPWDNQWRIAEMADAPVDALVAYKQGFGSSAEREADRISHARLQGVFVNQNGDTLDKDIADVNELRRLRGSQPSPSSGIVAAIAGDPVEPANIRVYMQRTANKTFYGCSNNCTKAVPFTYYQESTLPNERNEPSWPTASVVAGAMAVKIYAWYYALHPKWPQYNADITDTTADQVYTVGSAQAYSSNAVHSIAGEAMITATSRQVFLSQYGAGYYDQGNYHSGRMWQNGTHYWADQGQTWTWMGHYYYDQCVNTSYQNVTFIFY